MRYAGIIKNDLSAGKGVCVSFFAQGCDNHCKGCHNPESWDFKGGKEFTKDTLKEILEAIAANGIIRNFCVMGGEPLHEKNLKLVSEIVKTVRNKYPNILIYLWTGYEYEQLNPKKNKYIKRIFSNINYLIDGPFILEKRDITLPMRGSSNQRIINLKEQNNE